MKRTRENPRGWNQTERTIMFVSQRVSRRSFVGKASGAMMAVAGFAIGHEFIAPGSPNLALAVNCETTGSCVTDIYWCGICGKRCDLCGGTATSCPSGKVPVPGWAQCCNHQMVSFNDCCGTTPDSCNQKRCCRGSGIGFGTCSKSVGYPFWCPPSGFPTYTGYNCTYRVLSGIPC